MFCRQCGARLEENASFCMQCGTRVDAIPQPMPEAPATYQMPAQPLYTSPEIPPKKPINKRKLVLSLVSVLLCLSLIAGIFVYFTYYATAKRALRNAAEDSAEALQEFLLEGSELKKLVDALRNIDSEFTLAFKMNSGHLSLAFSSKQEILSMLLESTYYNQSLQIVADNEKLVLDTQELLGESYSIPLANLGKALLNSPLAESIPAELQGVLQEIDIRLFDTPALNSIKDQEFYKEFEEKMELEEVDTSIPHSKGVETVYRMKLDADTYMDYTTDCYKYMLEPIFGKQLISLLSYSMISQSSMQGEFTFLYGLDKKDRLVALHMTTEMDGEAYTVTLSLTGKKNPWEQIEIYTDDELQGTLTIEQEKDGFTVYADEECILQVDNEKFIVGPEGEDITIYYEVRNGGCYFSADFEGQHAELEILPKCEAKMPTGTMTDIFSLSMEELEALFEQLGSIFE